MQKKKNLLLLNDLFIKWVLLNKKLILFSQTKTKINQTMILAHYNLDNTKVSNILERFHTKFKRRRKFVPNPNSKCLPNIDTIKNIKIYKRTCKYVNENSNETKSNLVIKIQYSTKEYYILNVLYDDYKDLL